MELTRPLEQEQEQAYVQQVHALILAQLSDSLQAVDRFAHQLVAYNREMWKETGVLNGELDQAVTMQDYFTSYRTLATQADQEKKRAALLEQMEKSPFFGRFDFREQGELAESFYVGIGSLTDEDSGQMLVCDWRAPICSLFYEHTPGPASYPVGDNTIRGEMLLKRQYMIDHDKLEGMFDADEHIDDEVLQQVLSHNTSEHMHTIVSTIQREQNRIIRSDEHTFTLVLGAAGSGKTSVALHRIAYILYRNRTSRMEMKDLLIFSPNEVFMDYISGVLPELGEGAMQQTTFQEYIRPLIPGWRLEEPWRYLEEQIGLAGMPEAQSRAWAMQLKQTPGFMRYYQRYIQYLQDQLGRFEDVSVEGEKLIDGQEYERLYTTAYGSRPVGVRLAGLRERMHRIVQAKRERMTEQIAQRMRADNDTYRLPERSRLEALKRTAAARAQVERMTLYDAASAFMALFDPRIYSHLSGKALGEKWAAAFSDTLQALRRGVLRYEDAPIYACFVMETQQPRADSRIKHIVVDECQDYTPFHWRLLARRFPGAGVTALGDVHQLIGGSRPESTLPLLPRLFARIKDFQRYELQVCYRSTSTLTDFTRQMLPEGARVTSVDREGDKPLLIQVADEAARVQATADFIERSLEAGYGQIAVLTRTVAESRAAHRALSPRVSVQLLTPEDSALPLGPVIVPACLAKGLEFDAVMVYDAGKRMDGMELLLYTLCTRALHSLALCAGPEGFASVIAGMDPSTYRTEA